MRRGISFVANNILLNNNNLNYRDDAIDSFNQMRLQNELSCFFLTMGFIFFWITILMASSKMAFKPYWVRALHSMYLHWNSYSIILRAVSFMIGASFGSFLYIANYSLKSTLLPTKILGTFPTFYWSSGYHLIRYFLLFYGHWQRMRVKQLRRQSGKHHSWGRQEVSNDCTLLGQQYPIILEWPFFHQL